MKPVALVLMLLVAMQAVGIEIKGNTIAMSDAERKTCDDEGGCGVITAQYLRSALAAAYKAGQASTDAACRNRL